MIKKDKATTCEELKSKMDSHGNFVLVDVLPAPDFKALHIQGAINLPLDTLEKQANQVLPHMIEIIVYSAGAQCQGAHFAVEIIKKSGFKVSMLQGGLEAWVGQNYPLRGDQNHKAKALTKAPVPVPKPGPTPAPAAKKSEPGKDPQPKNPKKKAA